jgi:hypothetical protein
MAFHIGKLVDFTERSRNFVLDECKKTRQKDVKKTSASTASAFFISLVLENVSVVKTIL